MTPRRPPPGPLLAAALALAALAGCAGAPIDPAGADAGQVSDQAPDDTCADVANDPLNCGACGRTCVIPSATAGCEAGECVIAACPFGTLDADGELANGCEAVDEQASVEGCPADTVAIHRSNGHGHFYTSDLAAASTAPFHLEFAAYFQLATTPDLGRSPLNLCQKSDARHFLSSSDACEAGGTLVATLGYVATEERCGAIPLYRLFSPSAGDHFYTTDPAERDLALASHGYLTEGLAGHVWR